MYSENINMDELIARKTSPYYSNDPYILLGEYLTINYNGCLFVGFVSNHNDVKENIFVGISKEELQQNSGKFTFILDEDNGECSGYMNNVIFFKEKRDKIYYTIFKLSHLSDSIRESLKSKLYTKYWNANYFKEKLSKELNEYIENLINESLYKIIIFWHSEKDYHNEADSLKETLIDAILNIFPIKEQNESVSFSSIANNNDKIEILRWFTRKFEMWHLQPNEQFCFLVFKIPQYTDEITKNQNFDMRSQDFNSQGWLAYEYTGNIYINNADYIVKFYASIQDSTFTNLAHDQELIIAHKIVELFLTDIFDNLLSTECHNSNITSEYLKTFHTHLHEIAYKLFGILVKGEYLNEFVKPIISGNRIDLVKEYDKSRIRELLELTDVLKEVKKKDFHNQVNVIEVFFYLNLFFRRILMEIPQSMNIGFAPYLMEIGYVDPEPLKDIKSWVMRKDADIDQTPISSSIDALYKVLGEVEALFGIGGKEGWTSYMAPAPLYVYGQRRGFIFVVGNYHSSWLDEDDAMRKRDARLQYLCRLLRMNALYASKLLQEANESEFRKRISEAIITAKKFKESIIDNIHIVSNINSKAKSNIVLTEDELDIKVLKSENSIKIEIPFLIEGEDPEKLSMSLILGENETFILSGFFQFMRNLNEIIGLKEVSDIMISNELDRGWKKLAKLASHNLRNPLINLGIDIDLIEKDIKKDNDEEIYKTIAAMKSTISGAHKIIDQIKVSSSAVDANKMNFFLNDVLDNLKLAVKDPDIELSISCPDRIEIEADIVNIFQCFDELINNSRRWFNKSEKIIKIIVTVVDEENIHFKKKFKGKCVKIDYLDNGAGIQVESKKEIFDYGFHKTENGSGLGLWFVRQSINMHNGEIEETGTFGDGAHFEIFLPLEIKKQIKENDYVQNITS